MAFLVNDFGFQSQFVEMFDIEQIEVYRGPQGFNAVSGGIRGTIW